MQASSTELTFGRGGRGAADLQAVVDQVLAELVDPASDASARARKAGLKPADIADARIEVREGEQGMADVMTTIIVGIAVNAASQVAQTLWREVVWPRLRRRLGVDALGPVAGEE